MGFDYMARSNPYFRNNISGGNYYPNIGINRGYQFGYSNPYTGYGSPSMYSSSFDYRNTELSYRNSIYGYDQMPFISGVPQYDYGYGNSFMYPDSYAYNDCGCYPSRRGGFGGSGLMNIMALAELAKGFFSSFNMNNTKETEESEEVIEVNGDSKAEGKDSGEKTDSKEEKASKEKK